MRDCNKTLDYQFVRKCLCENHVYNNCTNRFGIPCILRGNCSLDEMNQSLLDKLQKWYESHRKECGEKTYYDDFVQKIVSDEFKSVFPCTIFKVTTLENNEHKIVISGFYVTPSVFYPVDKCVRWDDIMEVQEWNS